MHLTVSAPFVAVTHEEPTGRSDNYGFALAAQPGESQGRPSTNASSQLSE